MGHPYSPVDFTIMRTQQSKKAYTHMKCAICDRTYIVGKSPQLMNTYYLLLRPRGGFVSYATNTGRSHDNGNLTNAVHPDDIHTTHIHTL